MISFDKLTLKAQEALHAAQSHASEKGHPQVAPEHLLWALIEQKDGVVLPILQKLGVNLQTLARDLADAVAKLPKVQGQPELYMSPTLGRILEDALKEADQFKDEYVSTEHLLIALSNAKNEPASRLLESHGVTKDAILKVLVSIRGTFRIASFVTPCDSRSRLAWCDERRNPEGAGFDSRHAKDYRPESGRKVSGAA